MTSRYLEKKPRPLLQAFSEREAQRAGDNGEALVADVMRILAQPAAARGIALRWADEFDEKERT